MHFYVNLSYLIWLCQARNLAFFGRFCLGVWFLLAILLSVFGLFTEGLAFLEKINGNPAYLSVVLGLEQWFSNFSAR